MRTAANIWGGGQGVCVCGCDNLNWRALLCNLLSVPLNALQAPLCPVQWGCGIVYVYQLPLLILCWSWKAMPAFLGYGRTSMCGSSSVCPQSPPWVKFWDAVQVRAFDACIEL